MKTTTRQNFFIRTLKAAAVATVRSVRKLVYPGSQSIALDQRQGFGPMDALAGQSPAQLLAGLCV